MNDTALTIEVAYAGPQRVIVKAYALAQGACVGDAVRLAARDPDFAGVDLASAAYGIYGKVLRGNEALQDGDRVEIYRPLNEDPKTARRRRARQAGR